MIDAMTASPETTNNMGAEKSGDIELEQELDSLYRKVAGLDQPGDPDGTVSKTDKTKQALKARKSRARSTRKKKPRSRFSRLYWGLAFVLLFLGTIAVFYWPGIYSYGTFHLKGTSYLLRTNRLTGAVRYYDGKEWLRPPIDNGIIVLTAEESKDRGIAPLPVEENVKVIGQPSVAGSPPAGRQGNFAVQIRAFPEDQRQNALLFLEDVRKKTPDVSIETVSIPDRGVWYRILLGNFSTAEAAAEYQKSNSVAREHPYSFIQKRHGGSPEPVTAPKSAAKPPR